MTTGFEFTHQKRAIAWACVAALAAGLAACGGGGTTGQTLTGKVIDGYIKGATVCFDANSNGACDAGEPTAVTTEGGAFSLSVANNAVLGGANLLVDVPADAVDEDTGNAVGSAYTMRGVASESAVVTPITTVMAHYMDSGSTKSEAIKAALVDMGLAEDAIDPDADYVAAQTISTHNVAKLVAKLLQQDSVKNAANLKTALGTLSSVVPAAHGLGSAVDSAKLAELVTTWQTANPSNGGSSSETSGANLATFDEATPPTIEVFGGAVGTIAQGPAGGNGNALKITRNGGDVWAGAWLAIPAIPNNAGTQVVSAKVYSPVAGVKFVAKAEYDSNLGTGEVQANETVVAGWQTLTWTLPALDASQTYNRFVVLPDLGTAGSGQDYFVDDISVATQSGGGSSSSSDGTLATFDTETQPTVEVFGGATGTIDTSPTGGNGNALKVTRSGGEVWAGAWIPVPAIPSDSGTQVVSARVYSPLANIPMVAKAEYGDNQGSGDVQANETVVVGWQTLTWTLSNLDASKSYNRFVVLPQLGTQGAGETYYFDDITVAAGSSSSGGNNSGSGSTSSGEQVFTSGFSSAVLTASGGAVLSAGGSNLDDWGHDCSNDAAWCGSFAGGAGADSYAGFYYQTPSAPTGLYSQMEVMGPGVSGYNDAGDTGGVTITNQTKVNFTFNQNPEWFNSSNNKFGVVLTLGKRYLVGSQICRLQLHGVKTPTSADATTYSMNLVNDFRVASDCATGIAPDAVAAALAASPVVSSFKVLGADGGAAIVGRNDVASGANLSTAVNGVYPTTVVLKGAITFN